MTLALCLLPFVLLGLAPSTVNAQRPPRYLYPGCIQTACGASSCPNGLTQHWASSGKTDGTSCMGPKSLICCPFPVRGLQWTPIDLVVSHVCPEQDPCPSLNKELIFADDFGRDAKICNVGSFYMCEDRQVPTEVAAYKTWSSQGCYSDSASARSLPNSFLAPTGTTMTVARCLDAAAGFKYAGLEYGRECYYGNYLAPSASRQSGCSMGCEGASNQLCGAGNLMNLYLNSAYTQPATEKPSVGGWQSQGCYTDSASARGLTGGSSTRGDMTVEMCVGLAAGFKYAAIEYATECYWGNSLNSASTPAAGQCTMACGGDSRTLCGDGNRMSLYRNTAYQDAVTVPGVGSFFYRGCFVDDPNARILPGPNNDAGLTVQRCVSMAMAAGARYAGVENGNQCFFGNVLLSATTADGCNKPCVGDGAQLCGGARRMGVYENGGYQASTTKMTTTTAVQSTRSTSQQTTTTTAQQTTSTTAQQTTSTTTQQTTSTTTQQTTVESTTTTTTRPVTLQTTTTSFHTTTTTTTAAIATTFTPVTQQTTTTSSLATTTSAAPLVIRKDGSIGSFFHRSCFFDQESPRVLAADSLELPGAMTVGECVQFARRGLWRYAGVEFGYQCYVGNTLRSTSLSNQADCNQPCDGDASQACGAGNRILVYEDVGWVDPTAPMIIGVLRAYHNAMNRAAAAITLYQSHMHQLQSLGAGLQRRQVDAGLIEDLLREIGIDERNLRTARDLMNNAARHANNLFLMGMRRDIDTLGEAQVDGEQIELLEKTSREAGEALSRVSSVASSVATSIAGGASAGSISVGTSLNLASSGLATIGSLGSGGAATATGGVLAIVTLIQAFGGIIGGGIGIGGGGGSPTGDPSGTATSTTSECTATFASS